MTEDARDKAVSERRSASGRRAFFRGGRRESDWPSTVISVKCPRCQSPEAGFLDATPETLFWECRSCRHPWSTDPEGRPVE